MLHTLSKPFNEGRTPISTLTDTKSSLFQSVEHQVRDTRDIPREGLGNGRIHIKQYEFTLVEV